MEHMGKKIESDRSRKIFFPRGSGWVCRIDRSAETPTEGGWVGGSYPGDGRCHHIKRGSWETQQRKCSTPLHSVSRESVSFVHHHLPPEPASFWLLLLPLGLTNSHWQDWRKERKYKGSGTLWPPEWDPGPFSSLTQKKGRAHELASVFNQGQESYHVSRSEEHVERSMNLRLCIEGIYEFPWIAVPMFLIFFQWPLKGRQSNLKAMVKWWAGSTKSDTKLWAALTKSWTSKALPKCIKSLGWIISQVCSCSLCGWSRTNHRAKVVANAYNLITWEALVFLGSLGFQGELELHSEF